MHKINPKPTDVCEGHRIPSNAMWKSISKRDTCQTFETILRIQFAQAHQNWTIEDWKKVDWPDESEFLL